jgi:uncharacterized protein YcbK (DUF882 family)
MIARMAAILPRRAFLLGFGGLGLSAWPGLPAHAESPDEGEERPIDRAAVAASAGGRAVAGVRQVPWRLAAVNANTGERLHVVYRVGARVSSQAMVWISWFLRDWRHAEARPIDPHVIDLVAWLHAATGSEEPVQVLSGFRNRRTELILHPRGGPLVENSPHTAGIAVDLRIPGVDSRWLRDAALALGRGGVGHYRSGFVHLDTGPVRRWEG